MRGFTIEQLDFLFNNQVPTRKFSGYKFEVAEGEAVFESTEAVDGEFDKTNVKAVVTSTHQAVKKAL